MFEPSLEEKQKYLDDLGKFVNEAENYMKDLCSSVGWNYDSLYNYEETEKYALCPFNNGHRVPERTMHKHLVKCEWKALGYTDECKSFPEPVLPSDDSSTIKFDMHLQTKVLREAKEKNPELNISLDEKFIPQTSDRLTSDFSSDEKKVIYDYVITNTVGPDIGYDIIEMNKLEKTNDNKEESTAIQMLLAQERNLKRRRAKHRGVHTNKKSHIEIMRELVQNQMEMYREHLSEKYGIPIPDDDENSKSSIQKDYEDDLDENGQQLSGLKRDRKNRDNGDKSDYKNKYNSRGTDKKSEKERSNGRDHSLSHTHPVHYKDYDYKNSNKRDSGSSSRRHYDTGNKYRDDYNSRDKYNSRGKYRDTCEPRNKDKDRYDSHDRSRDKYDSRHKNKEKYESRDSNKDKNTSRDSSKDNKQDSYEKSEDSYTIRLISKNELNKDKNTSRDSSKDNKHDSYEKSEESYTIRFISKNEYNFQNTIKDKCNKYDLDQTVYGTCSKNDDRNESSDKKESVSIDHISRNRKRKKSKSNERDFVENPEHDAKEKSSHKKYKKEHKHKKQKSRDKEDNKNHKKFKHKRDRDSRS